MVRSCILYSPIGFRVPSGLDPTTPSALAVSNRCSAVRCPVYYTLGCDTWRPGLQQVLSFPSIHPSSRLFPPSSIHAVIGQVARRRWSCQQFVTTLSELNHHPGSTINKGKPGFQTFSLEQLLLQLHHSASLLLCLEFLSLFPTLTFTHDLVATQ